MTTVDYKQLCHQIFLLDQNVRFAGVLNSDGKLVAGGFREGIEPLYDQVNERLWFNQIAIRREMSTMFDRSLGRLHYVFVEREKTKHLTFYVDNETVFVSLQPWVSPDDAVELASSILNLLKSD